MNRAGGRPRRSAYSGDRECLGCHAEKRDDWRRSIYGLIHYDRSIPAERRGCEGCHGPGADHSDGGDISQITNPAYLVPLIELSPGRLTAPEVTVRMKALLEGIGKVPVVCAARPGFIVPRIQALAMNEAARMVEEGVASAEDIDKAVIYGFGFRFAVLGLLEFIDWGGGDILHHASRYLVEALGDSRYAAPDIIETNMREGRIGKLP